VLMGFILFESEEVIGFNCDGCFIFGSVSNLHYEFSIFSLSYA